MEEREFWLRTNPRNISALFLLLSHTVQGDKPAASAFFKAEMKSIHVLVLFGVYEVSEQRLIFILAEL